MRLLLICHPEEGFSPTRDLQFDFFSTLFGRADRAFHSFLILEPEDWTWSSFNHYATGVEGVVEIESEWTGRSRERMGMPLRVKIVPTLSPKDGEKDWAPQV